VIWEKKSSTLSVSLVPSWVGFIELIEFDTLIFELWSCYCVFVTVISIPRPLREKLGDDGADALVDLLGKVNDGTRQDIMTLVEEKFERRLAAVEATLIKWMFIFWVGQIGVITGILFAFFKR
jgi:hypothetical protein